MSWQDRFASALQQRKEAHLLRQRQTLQSPQSTHVTCGSSQLLNFCSNDYLGLANTGGEDLARAAQEWQFGSGASHLVCGH
ncbi:MAG: 8-amino-7-oxononanoate synthase, partial [Pseudomonadota bacterium]|nr:8-amino-7-oxononanoate synthase [Pseudomonadota bacterium]